MKIIRYKKSETVDSYGLLEGQRIVPIVGPPYGHLNELQKEKSIDYSQHLLLPPCEPTKIIALALNFEGIDGQEKDIIEPLVFLKSSNAVAGINDIIELPFIQNTWGEPEIGAVIGKTTKDISMDFVDEHILGYTPANDVSCDNVNNRDHHLLRSKAADGFCPIGPYIETEYDPNGKTLEAYHNDQLIRKGSTDAMLWDLKKAIQWLSTWITLHPGDIVLSGCPPYVRDPLYLMHGDVFKVKIQGLPALTTQFKKGQNT